MPSGTPWEHSGCERRGSRPLGAGDAGRSGGRRRASAGGLGAGRAGRAARARRDRGGVLPPGARRGAERPARPARPLSRRRVLPRSARPAARAAARAARRGDAPLGRREVRGRAHPRCRHPVALDGHRRPRRGRAAQVACARGPRPGGAARGPGALERPRPPAPPHRSELELRARHLDRTRARRRLDLLRHGGPPARRRRRFARDLRPATSAPGRDAALGRVPRSACTAATRRPRIRGACARRSSRSKSSRAPSAGSATTTSGSIRTRT